MKWSIALVACLGAFPAAAQTARNQSGAPAVQTHLQSLGYKDVQGLRQGPDGQWTGKATRNGVPHTVTVAPSGQTIAR